MNENGIRPCFLAGACAHACSSQRGNSTPSDCYMTTLYPIQVRGIDDCKVMDDGTIAISYPTRADEKNILYEVVALLGQEEAVTFRQIHYICTNDQPGPITSCWPLIWNGRVQCDGKTLTFEFVERKDIDD